MKHGLEENDLKIRSKAAIGITEKRQVMRKSRRQLGRALRAQLRAHLLNMIVQVHCIRRKELDAEDRVK